MNTKAQAVIGISIGVAFGLGTASFLDLSSKVAEQQAKVACNAARVQLAEAETHLEGIGYMHNDTKAGVQNAARKLRTIIHECKNDGF